MKYLVDRTMPDSVITQDLGIGMMLWMTHFFPEEEWAQIQRPRCLQILDQMWNEEEGFFCREPTAPQTKFAFTNYGVSVGLQAVGETPQRVERLNRFFDSYRSHDPYDRDAITHVMACSSHFPGLLLSTRNHDNRAQRIRSTASNVSGIGSAVLNTKPIASEN